MTRVKLVRRIRMVALVAWAATVVASAFFGDAVPLWAVMTICAVVWAYCSGWMHLYEEAQFQATMEKLDRMEAELAQLPVYRSFSESRGLRLNGHHFGRVDDVN